MPRKAARPCAQPGCPNLVRDGRYCEDHKAEHQWQRSDGQQRSSSQRGYGARWRKLRKMALGRQPLCADPFGYHAERGEVVPATEVDHIHPKARGGDDALDNLQGLCWNCHRCKTIEEQRLRRDFRPAQCPVTIVAGPPGAGKTTYVRKHSKWGDLIVDVDALYHALSGQDWYDKPQVLLPFVCEARDAVIHRLARASSVRRAWLITGQADPTKLTQLRDQLSAELIVLEVSGLECERRISQDSRRQDRLEQWRALVAAWWQVYRG